MNNQTCRSSRCDVIDAIRGTLDTIEAAIQAAHGTTNAENANEHFGYDNDMIAASNPPEGLDESLRSAYSTLQSAVGMIQQRGRESTLAEHGEESTDDVFGEAQEQQEGTMTLAPHRSASGTDAGPTPLTSSSTPHGIIWGQQPLRPLDSTPLITLTDAADMKAPPPPAEILESGKKLLAIRKQMESKGFGPADKAKNPTKKNPRIKPSPGEIHLSVLRQVALSLALQKGRLDIVQLMVGKNEWAFDYEPSSSQATLDVKTKLSKKSTAAKRGRDAIDAPESDAATTRFPTDAPEADEERFHLGWDPHFNTSDAENIRKDAVTAHPILKSFISVPPFRFPPLPGMRVAPRPGIGINVNGCMAHTSLNALHRACYYGHLPIVRHLVEVCGMDVNEPTAYIGEFFRKAPRHSTLYPIHFAVRNAASSGDMSVVRYLVCDRKCDKDSRMFFSTVAIIPATCKENVKSSNVYAALEPGYTALHMIIDSDVRMSEGDTQNFEALRYRSRVVRSLLRMGFSGNAKTRHGSQIFALVLSSLMKGDYALVNCLLLRPLHRQLQARCLKREIQSTAVTLNGILNRFPSLCGNLDAQISNEDLAFYYSTTGSNRRALFMPLYCVCPQFFRNYYRWSDSQLEEIREQFSTTALQIVLANGTSIIPTKS